MRFGDFPAEYCEYANARVVLLPIPFDKTSSWVKGADKGPQAILNASPYLEWFDIETGAEAYRAGIHVADPIVADTPQAMVQAAHARVTALHRDGKFVVTIGGEHSVSLGPVRALAAAYPGLSVLQLDAHADTRQEYEGDPLSHACIMARIKEHVNVTVAVGIRSIDASEHASLPPKRTFYAHEMRRAPDWMDRALDQLTDPVYVTIDLDCFDPSALPATGTPEPGGMDWYQVTDLLHAVARARRVAGFDIVELCPCGHKPSEFLAAKLLYAFLCYIHAHNAWA